MQGYLIPIYILPPVLGMVVVFFFMYRMFVRSQQVYLVRRSDSQKPVSKLAGVAFFAIAPIISGAIATVLVDRATAGLEAADYLSVSAGLAVATVGFFTNLGNTFVCTEAVEELIREAKSTSKYVALASLSVLSLACAMTLLIIGLRNAPAFTAQQAEIFLRSCEVFSGFTIGAFVAGFLPTRVRESISTSPGFRKRLGLCLAGHLVVVSGLAVALLLLRMT